jgi:hypothetical protein
MKKFRILFLLLAAGTLLAVGACKKESHKSCSELETDFSNALIAFLTSQTEANCNDYVDALRAYINGCGTLTPAQRATFEDEINQTDCSPLP